MADKVETPADFVPLHAMAYGKEDEVAVPVSLTTPMPVASGLLTATMSDLSFLTSTPIVDASTTDSLCIILNNTTGRNIYLYNRIFANDHDAGDDNMLYKAYINPTAVLATALTGVNATVGEVSSTATIRYEAGPTIDMGGIEATGEILPNGSPYSRPLIGKLRPGFSAGFALSPTGNPAATTKLSIILEWWEELL